MELKKSTKKVLAYICAIALLVASMTGYQAKTVNAAESIVANGVTYTVGDPTGNYEGFTLQGAYDNVRFGFAWSGDPNYASPVAQVEIQQNGTVVRNLGSQNNGMSIWLTDLTDLGDGTYTIVFKGSGDFANAVENVPLTISGTGQVGPQPTTEPVTIDPTVWTDATEKWTTDGAWNIWTGNGATSKFKGHNTLDDFYVNTITTTGEWSVQASAVIPGHTVGTQYTYTITIDSDMDNTVVRTREEISGTDIISNTLVKGENKLEGTFTAAQTNAKLFLDMGDAANTGATFHITDVEIKDASGVEVTTPAPTTPGEQPSVEPTTPAPTTPASVPGDQTIGAATSAELMSAAFLLGDVGAGQYKAVCGSGTINEVVNIQQPGAAAEAGIYVSFKDANFGTMTVNGETLNAHIEGAGVVMYLSNFKYMYSDVVVTNGDGSEKAVIYVYNAQGIDNSNGSQVEPTTPGESGEQPSVEPTVPSQTEQKEDTEAAGYAGLASEAFLLGDVGAGQYKAVCGKGTINEIVNIQQPGAAAEAGIYVSFKDANFGKMTVNGAPLNAHVEGAGVVMYLSNFKYMYSDVVVTNGDGTEKAVIYVYNSQGIDNSDSAIDVPTTTPQVTTPGSEPPTAGEGTTFPLLSLQQISTYIVYVNYASYKAMITPGKVAYVGVDPANRDHIQVKNASGPGSDSPGSESKFVVARQFRGGMTSGVKYVLSVDITPSVAQGSYKTMTGADWIPLQAGTTTVSIVSTAYPSNGAIVADFSFNLDKLGPDVVLDISNPQVREYVEGETINPPTTTPQVTTTPQASTTTGQNTTTVAPTTAGQNPTVAPTTKPSVKVTKPAQAKIKKIYKKKKSAKKVKLSIKKINGVVGYQVAIFKTKKNAKKNKKALVKKIVKKIKPTITSKKLKNKKTLYVKVRAYVLDANGKKLYGNWSKIKQVKIKK